MSHDGAGTRMGDTSHTTKTTYIFLKVGDNTWDPRNLDDSQEEKGREKGKGRIQNLNRNLLPKGWSFKQDVVDVLFIGKLKFHHGADMRTSELIYFTYREMKKKVMPVNYACIKIRLQDNLIPKFEKTLD